MADIKEKPAKKRGRPKRHGGYTFLIKGGELPENRRYLRHYLSEIRAGLAEDLGGESELTTAQRILLDRIISYLGIIRLIEEHARDHGVIDSRGRPTSGLTGHYLTFNRQVREMLSLLGIERRELVKEPTLIDVIREHDRGKDRS